MKSPLTAIALLNAGFLMTAFTAAAPAEAPAAVAVLVDQRLPNASLDAADGVGVTLTVDGKSSSTPWSGLVRWGSPAAPAGRPRVVLRDGTQIVAAPAWTREGSVLLNDNEFAFLSATLRPVKAARDGVAHVLFEAARDHGLEEAFHRGARSRGGERSDELYLVDGDVLAGELLTIRKGLATLLFSGEQVEIPLGRVSAVRLAGDDQDAARTSTLVGLADGSLLRARSLTIDEQGVRVRIASGPELTAMGRAGVVFLQPLGGGATYLSDLAPLDYRHTPYAGVAWPLGRDANLFGGPLAAGGERFPKGLAMHSPSRVVYRLTPGEHTRLDFSMAIDGNALSSAGGPTGGGSVVYRVLVAGAGGFRPAFTSPVVRSGEAPRLGSVEIADARAIALVIEPADFGDRLDHANWLDARLVRSGE